MLGASLSVTLRLPGAELPGSPVPWPASATALIESLTDFLPPPGSIFLQALKGFCFETETNTSE